MLLEKIQEKEQSQNVQFIRVEQWTPNPIVNVVTRSGVVTGGQPAKPSGPWVRKAEDKQRTIDMDKINETFVHANKEFYIPNPPSMKGKEPQVLNISIEL